jgi:hypothetical protein
MRKSKRKQKEGYQSGIKATHKIVWSEKKNKYGLPNYVPNLVSNG